MHQLRVVGFLRALILAIGLLTAEGGAMAQPVDPALKAYRGQVFAALDAHVQAIGDIVEGKVPLWHHIPDHAVAIVGSSRGLLEIHPEKTAPTPRKNGEDKVGEDGAKPPAPTPFAAAAVKLNEQAAQMVQLSMSDQRDLVVRQYVVLKEAYDALRKQTE
jgi:cytochrome c556